MTPGGVGAGDDRPGARCVHDARRYVGPHHHGDRRRRAPSSIDEKKTAPARAPPLVWFRPPSAACTLLDRELYTRRTSTQLIFQQTREDS